MQERRILSVLNTKDELLSAGFIPHSELGDSDLITLVAIKLNPSTPYHYFVPYSKTYGAACYINSGSNPKFNIYNFGKVTSYNTYSLDLYKNEGTGVSVSLGNRKYSSNSYSKTFLSYSDTSIRFYTSSSSWNMSANVVGYDPNAASSGAKYYTSTSVTLFNRFFTNSSSVGVSTIYSNNISNTGDNGYYMLCMINNDVDYYVLFPRIDTNQGYLYFRPIMDDSLDYSDCYYLVESNLE